MRRIILALAALLITLPLIADNAPKPDVVGDVIRMAKAGVDADAIIVFVQKTDGKFDVTANDLIAMTEANVPKAVIKAVIDEADARDGGRDRYRDTRYAAPRVVVGVGAPYYYDPYFYDPWFWYGPRLSLNFGFGRGFYGGRHFGGGGGHHRHR